MDLSPTADLLRTLSDENRLRILHLLQKGSLCVCDLERVLDLQQSNLSRHLAKLKTEGLIRGEKKGLFTHYTLKLPEGPAGDLVRQVLAQLQGSEILRDDFRLSNPDLLRPLKC